MKTYVANSLRFDCIRAHPWNVAEYDSRGKYVDFKSEIDLIEETLEDFKPYSHEDGILKFYDLVRDINEPAGALETNDCALRPPGAHQDTNSKSPVVVRARLCLLYREAHFNLPPNAMRWLMSAFEQGLEEIDPELGADQAVVGFTLQPTAYVDLPDEPEILEGQLLMLSFWAYGQTDSESFDMLGRAASNVKIVSSAISDHVKRNFNREGILGEIKELRADIILPQSDELKKVP